MLLTYITRNSPGDDIAKVNFFYDDVVHEFGEITENKGHNAVQGHSRSPNLVQSKAHIRLPSFY